MARTHNAENSIAILLFSKTPENPQAKSRLRETFPDLEEQIQELHKAFIGDTLQKIRSTPCKHKLISWLSEDGRPASLLPSLPGFESFWQQGSDLPERIRNGIEHTWQEHDPEAVIILGSDCPNLKTADLLQAVEIMKRQQVAIGPTQSGFYLLGIPRAARHIELAEEVYPGDQVHNLKTLYTQFRPELLQERQDIDTAQDLCQLIRQNKNEESLVAQISPETGKIIASLRLEAPFV